MASTKQQMSCRIRDLVMVLGLPFDNLTMDELVAELDLFIRSGEPHLLATANVNFVVKAIQDPEFSQVVQMADVITPDGMPILWAARLLRCPLKERVAGSDLVPRMAKEATVKGYRMMLLGGAPGIGELAVSHLKKQYPGLDVHAFCPPFDPLLEMNSEAIVDRVRAIKPDLLFVSFSAGKSEKWLAMHLKQIDVPVCAGVGATIDFLAGHISRAPLWMQKSGLEWVYRLLREPGRMWRRYGGDLLIFGWAFIQAWTADMLFRVLGKKHVTTQLQTTQAQSGTVYTLKGRLDATNNREYRMQIRELLTQGIPVFVDMQEVSFVDSSGLGMLVCLEKEARTFQVPFILINPSTQVRNSLRVARLDKILHIESTLDKAENECVDPRQWFVKKTVKPGPGVLRIWLEGRIDASVQKEFEEVLHYHVSGIHEIQRLELDLSSVTFIDSAGLIVLIKLHKQLIRKSGGLYIVQSSEIVQKILRVMRMDQYLGKSEKKAHFQQYTRGSF